jgi:hypothetical protein
MSRTTIALATAAVFLAACAGSPTVASVDGEEITAAEVTALNTGYTDQVVYSGEAFRRDLSLLVVNLILLASADEQFALSGLDDPAAIADKIDNPSQGEAVVLDNLSSDRTSTPELVAVAAQYFVIRDAVIAELAPGAPVGDEAAGAAFNAWAGVAVGEADVEIRSQVGVWGGPGSGIEPPPSG